MATLAGAEIFASGTHNGCTFTDEDLDGIVRAFEALGLAGRIPLKLGHNAEQPMTDGQPSLGWVERIWREGKKLLADFRDVPAIVYEAIRNGRYKHVSVELLRDVQAATGMLPLVLDAVALLGADIPAVSSLRDLQSLALTRLRGAERLVFTKTLPETFTMHDELNQLRDQLASTTQQLVQMTLEDAVRSKRILPAAREMFFRRYKDRGTVAEAAEWIATSPRPVVFSHPASRAPEYPDPASGAPDAQLVARTRRYLADNELRHLQLTGERLTFSKAAEIVAREVARTSPELLRAYLDQPGEV